jgi:hypothetical protein
MQKLTTAEFDKIDNPTSAEFHAWRNHLRAEHGTGEDQLPATVEAKIYMKAYEDGHSGGNHEIECIYGGLADLVLEVAAHFNKK